MPIAPTDNPFTALTFIAAPAILTNASSVLALGTSNRFARAVDRARALAAQLDESESLGRDWHKLRFRQMVRVERRSRLLVHALATFYGALGAFASASLVSLVGALFAETGHHFLFRSAAVIALIVGVGGVAGLTVGCTLLVTETRLAVANLVDESSHLRTRYAEFIEQSDR
jgi:hypothetical protein